MAKKSELADLAADVTVSPPRKLTTGYRDYERYRVTFAGADGKPVEQNRDVLRAGKVVAVLPLDLSRDEIVLLRQFRLAAHLANGRGDLVEIVAGRVEPGESLSVAANRECREEIGVAPTKLIELFSYLPTPGIADEEITVFLGAVDASAIKEGAIVTTDSEQLHLMRAPIDAVLATLQQGALRNGPLLLALQWLALNRSRLAALLV